MGNCCLKHESSMQWGGDDWGPCSPEHIFPTKEYNNKARKMEEEALLVDDHRNNHNGNDSFFNASTTSTSTRTMRTTITTEVKIKVTKRQLEKLLGKVDIKELSVQQVLSQLMSISDEYETHQRSWRPALQSIPE